MIMDLYIDEKDKELGRARLSQGGEGTSAAGGAGRAGGGGGRARGGWELGGARAPRPPRPPWRWRLRPLAEPRLP